MRYRPGARVQVAGIPGVHLVAAEQIETVTITLGERHGSKFIGEPVIVQASRVHPLPQSVEVWPVRNLNFPDGKA